MATEKQAQQLPGRKELRKQIAGTMEAALPELREILGEKKFQSRLKKMAKLLTEGLHKDDLPEKINKPKITVTAKKAPKKAAAKTAKKAASGKSGKALPS